MDRKHNYASPAICQQLNDLGLTDKVSAFWKVYQKECLLVSYEFDTENYYRQADGNLDFITPCLQTIPAYTIAELELLMPDYSMSMISGEYKINYSRYITSNFKSSSNRIADAYALAVLDLIQNNIIIIEKANAAICQTN